LITSCLVYLPLSFIYRKNNFISLIVLLVFWAIGIVLAVFAERQSRKVIKYFNGKKAEYNIFFRLLKLSKDFHLLQSLIINGKSNIDFVVVGPTGIFAIEVKSHKGFIVFNGGELTRGGKPFEKDFLSQTMKGAININGLIKKEIGKDFFVQPILVFSNIYRKLIFKEENINRVFVVSNNSLNRRIYKNHFKFSKEEVNRVVEALEKYQESELER